MSKVPDLRDLPEIPPELVEAGKNGELVLFVGAGISMLANFPSWRELAARVLDELCEKGFLDFSELEQLRGLDPKKQLSIAKQLANENGYPLNVGSHFPARAPASRIYEVLNALGCVCVTTNYDEMLVPASDDGNRAAGGRRIVLRENLLTNTLDVPGTVIHLHGSISAPENMIVATGEYLEHYDSEAVRVFLQHLFATKTVLFLGYGLEEAEILEHILRRGGTGLAEAQARRRFALQGFFRSQDPLYRKLHHYYEKTFGVHVVGFVRDFQDYGQQELILTSWARQLEIRPPSMLEDVQQIQKVLGDG